MKKYQFSDELKFYLEQMEVPFAIYQFVDKKVVTLVLSKGFCKLFGYNDMRDAYYDMDNDMYRDTHKDDVSKIENAAIAFAVNDVDYNVHYRSKKPNGFGYNIIHSRGKHIVMGDGTKLAQIWYMCEGEYNHNDIEDIDYNRMVTNSFSNRNDINDYYDYLTGLPMMNYFFEIAESEAKNLLNKNLLPTILFIDFTGMRNYNGQYGFEEGDKILHDLSRLLIKHFGNENCSRFSQDHFGVITDNNNLEKRLKQLFKDVEKINDNMSLPLRVGIYCYDYSDIDISIAYDRAKYACDTLRNNYYSCFVYFDDEMKLQMNKKQYIIEHIDKAIQNKWIQAYYQPIVRSANGRVCNEEALARWFDPEKGMLSPADFIPILESTSLAYKLDLYILDVVLEKLHKQEEAGLLLVPQSINISRSDFSVCDIVEEIRTRVDNANISRDLIVVEITESTVGSDFNYIKKQIERFQELGFSVWMDDFGSGYSSLNMLEEIKFDLIKFDMRFLQKLKENKKGQIILTELINMVTSLGIVALCEGVETKEQLNFLQEIGCSKLQGYYFAKPMPFEKIVERYQKGIQIGFERPEQASYFETIGRINLNDLSSIVNDSDNDIHNVYNKAPMAVIELRDGKMRYSRYNQSFNSFMSKTFNIKISKNQDEFLNELKGHKESFFKMIKICANNNSKMFIDEKLDDNSTIHYCARKTAFNNYTNTVAITLAILSITKDDTSTTYANIARALATDYYNLFYVNLENDDFIEYNSQIGGEDMTMERHGKHFFDEARGEALKRLFPLDRDIFLAEFTKQNVIKQIEEQDTFVITYRLLSDDSKPFYVNMKATKMSKNSNYIIIGISNVDAQIKEKERYETTRQEQISYSRIMALTGNFICLYVVDPISGYYSEFSSTLDYDKFGIDKTGVNFFQDGRDNAKLIISKEDMDYYLNNFNKKNILKDIDENGIYTLRYHIILNNIPTLVELRAIIVDESDGKKLIVGVNKLKTSK